MLTPKPWEGGGAAKPWERQFHAAPGLEAARSPSYNQPLAAAPMQWLSPGAPAQQQQPVIEEVEHDA